jgi:hypothetical protein
MKRDGEKAFEYWYSSVLTPYDIEACWSRVATISAVSGVLWTVRLLRLRGPLIEFPRMMMDWPTCGKYNPSLSLDALANQAIELLISELSTNEARSHPLEPSHARESNAMLLKPREWEYGCFDCVGAEEEVEQERLNIASVLERFGATAENMIVQW